MGETIDRALASGHDNDHELRQAVREAAHEDAMSIASLAPEMGVGKSTLQAWITNTYRGRSDTISAQARAWLNARAAKQHVRTHIPAQVPFVETQSAVAFMALLRRAQYEPGMVCLTGEPGVGKTESCREYKRRGTNVWMMTASRSTGSVYGMLDHLCEVLGRPEGNASRRQRAILTALRGTSGLIIVDEAQHLTMDAVDELRLFHDAPDVRIGIALVGNSDVRKRMMGGGKRGQYAQLTSRISAHLRRPAPLQADILAMLDAEGVTGPAERSLLRAAASKAGALREMKFLLRSARMIQQELEEPELTARHIQMADESRRAELAEAM